MKQPKDRTSPRRVSYGALGTTTTSSSSSSCATNATGGATTTSTADQAYATVPPHSPTSFEEEVTSPLSTFLPVKKANTEYLFKYLILVQIFMYLEAGAVPALLEEFALVFQLTPQEQGLLGAIVYIAISAASLTCSTMFRAMSPRVTLGYAMIINNFMVLLFALTPTDRWFSKSLLVFLRGCIGFTQAFQCVYTPLWVHEYAPKAKRASWMSYVQGAVPIGITLGYLAGSVTLWSSSNFLDIFSTSTSSSPAKNSTALPGAMINASTPSNLLLSLAAQTLPSMRNNRGVAMTADEFLGGSFPSDHEISICSGMYCWRWPFLFQCVMVLPFTILIFFVPDEHINLRIRKSQSIIIIDSAVEDVEGNVPTVDNALSGGESFSDDEQDHIFEKPKMCSLVDLKDLLSHKVFVFVVLGLSALFFVVAGVQFWTTLYLMTNTNDSLYRIHLSYLLVSGTGPILGVFFGGWLIDRCGGYVGPHEARALQICLVLGIVACGSSLPVSFLHSCREIAPFLWMMLFCGGAILPACSGIVISSTPARLRPLASSVAYMSYNMLGHAASNYIPGLIMSLVTSISFKHGPFIQLDMASCDTACTYRVGFRIVLWWSIWAIFCMLLAACFSARNLKKMTEKQKQKTATSKLETPLLQDL